MDFLRHSKRLQLFEPTSTHCVYSADADVILLSISLNIENICIIREDSTKNCFGFVIIYLYRLLLPLWDLIEILNFNTYSWIS